MRGTSEKRKKRYLKSNNGITLIALVVTIIVLLILAGIAISMLAGDNGILNKAAEAKVKTDEAQVDEAIRLAVDEAVASQHTGSTLSATEISAKTNNEITGATPNVITEIKEFNENDETKYLPIPKGMAYVEGTIDTGAVVVDSYGNEFVWVPIVSGAETTNDEVWSAPGESPNLNNITDKIDYDYEDMLASVNTYGGFYVGRYETSWTGSRVASVKNIEPMTGVTQVNGSGANWYTFYTESKNLYNDSVVSSMIYYSQWNAIMIWMNDVINPNAVGDEKRYIKDSTEMGNYSGDKINTGSNEKYKIKNIYDLAGNVAEWTQKTSDNSKRFARGGVYSATTIRPPASAWGPSSPISLYYECGSRLAIYIK